MISISGDRRLVLREAVHCRLDAGRTRVANYSSSSIILPAHLRPVWEGVIARLTVDEITQKHLAANYPGAEAANQEQARRETLELISLLIDRRIIAVEGASSLWQEAEPEK